MSIFLFSSFFIYQKTKENIIKADNQNMFSRCDIVASKVEISPVVIPLPEENEKIKIDYYDKNVYKTLFSSKDFPYIQDSNKDFFIIDLKNQRVAVKTFNKDSYEQIKVYVAKSNASLKKDNNSLIYIFLMGNLLSILLASSISYFLAGYLLKPINQIILRARQINLSDKPELLTVSNTNDELEMLSETINNMLERIHQSVKMQSNFFASASHELKTPLAILQNEIEVNLADPKTSEEMKLFFRSQLEEVNRLKRLVDDFLTISQLNNKVLKLRHSKFELDELIIDVLQKINPLLVKSSLFINFILDEKADNFEINADKDKITNILINLLENAIKYSSAKEIILSLNYHPVENKYLIKIENKISKFIESIDSLKNEFYRADILKDGHGMGLWISEKLISLHNGSLEINQIDNNFIVDIKLNP